MIERRPSGIVIHHSATKDSETVSWGAIRDYHKNVNKWRDIGYHFGIEKIGNTYEILLGRMPNEEGAHTVGFNSMIGICLVGNFDREAPAASLIDKAVVLCKYLCAQYGIHRTRIYGHRDFAAKTCPGANFDMEEFRRLCQ